MNHQTASTTSDSNPSMINSHRQSNAEIMAPETGAVSIPPSGANIITNAFARPTSFSGNQLLTIVKTTGSIPPSETPRIKRRTSN
ncbi:hypothetical protein D3C87_1980590 [compost metagenome]